MPPRRVVLVADGRTGQIKGEAPAFPGQERLYRVLFDGAPASHEEYRRGREPAPPESPDETLSAHHSSLGPMPGTRTLTRGEADAFDEALAAAAHPEEPDRREIAELSERLESGLIADADRTELSGRLATLRRRNG